MGCKNCWICRVTHAYSYPVNKLAIPKLPFTLSNKVELFECIRSLGLRNAISMSSYI